MVNVGIIGHGSCWETEYEPVLRRLRKRIRIRAVYDSVAARAAQTAEQLRAVNVEGMIALAARPDVQAVLILDSSWHGLESVRAVSRMKKPAFIVGPLDPDHSPLLTLHKTVVADGLTVMPMLSERYTPATIRLQELLATKLGKACEVSLECSVPGPASEAIERRDVRMAFARWFDWIRHVLRVSPTEVEAELRSVDDEPTKSELSIRLHFTARENRPPTFAEIHLQSSGERPQNGESSDVVAVKPCVRCEAGTAILKEPTKLSWTNGEADAKPVSESLRNERSATEVMLDHFLRRVVGGLIPVPDLNDVCRGLDILEAVDMSLKTGNRVAVEFRK